MKILFVCRGNIGRSQMAAAFYNHKTKTEDAQSAGTDVERPGESLRIRTDRFPDHTFVIEAMQEVGIDVSNATTTQLTKDMPAHYDMVINMANHACTPRWLASAPRYTYWKIRDPRGRSLVGTIRARNQIQQKINKFLTDSSK